MQSISTTFSPPIADDDVVSAMMECHARIRTFVDGLGRIAALDDLADPRAPDAARACARYFREGLPLHGRDEDESLAPALRAVRPGPAVEHALDRMTAEHGDMDVMLPGLLAMLDEVATGHGTDPTAFRVDVAAFSALMLSHIALEEDVIFPACGAIPAAVRRRIRVEMRDRRR